MQKGAYMPLKTLKQLKCLSLLKTVLKQSKISYLVWLLKCLSVFLLKSVKLISKIKYLLLLKNHSLKREKSLSTAFHLFRFIEPGKCKQ